MSITIKDVAKLSSVSPSTVSRVIANNPKISESTVKKVREAMEELKYKPNAIARSLASKKTNTLGLIIPNSEENLFRNPFFLDAMRGISIYARKNGYHIMYTYSISADEEMKYISEYIDHNLVDGIILLTALENDKCIEYLNNRKFPFSVIGRPDDLSETLWVDNDNVSAMHEMVEYLIKLGHKKIGFIGGPKSFNFSIDRLNGYKDALRNNNIIVDESIIDFGKDFDKMTGYIGAGNILKSSSVDAIVTTDDMIALGAIERIKKENRSNLLVTGFNNTLKNICNTVNIPTVDIKSEKLGYYSAKLLIENLNKKENEGYYIIETELKKHL